jgi:phospholipid/cholesterol/gamma-HCH transport system substrate-binding protein
LKTFETANYTTLKTFSNNKKMKISNINLLKLGLFVILGLLIFFAALFYLGQQKNLFRTGIRVWTEFYDVKGLQAGNEVRFLGTTAGHVAGVQIISDTMVRVELVLQNRMAEFIRLDSKVEILNEGIMGSKIVTIHPGSPEHPTIRSNSKLPSISTMSIEEIFGAIEGAVDYATRAAENLWQLSEYIVRGDGVLSSLIYDPATSDNFNRISDNLIALTDEANQVVRKINREDNDLNRLISDQVLTNRISVMFDDIDSLMVNLQNFSGELTKASRAINREEGLIHRLLYDRQMAEEVDTTIVSLRLAVEDMVETSQAIRRSWIINLFRGGRKER